MFRVNSQSIDRQPKYGYQKSVIFSVCSSASQLVVYKTGNFVPIG